MRLSNFFIESIGLYLPETYSTESAVADGYLDADTREKTGWTGTAVAGDISAPDMAVIATREALSRRRLGTNPIRRQRDPGDSRLAGASLPSAQSHWWVCGSRWD